MRLETWLRSLLAGLRRELRWKHPDPEKDIDATHENVLMHAYKMAWVVQLMVALEEQYGDMTDIRAYKMLQAAVNHDIGEAVNGDVLYDEKTEDDEQQEVEAYVDLMRTVVPLGCAEHFPLSPDASAGGVFTDREVQFWDVCEKVGYLIFLHEEYCLGKTIWKLIVIAGLCGSVITCTLQELNISLSR